MKKTFKFRTNAELREAMTPRQRNIFTSDDHELTVVHEDGGGYRMGISTEQALELMEQIGNSGLSR